MKEYSIVPFVFVLFLFNDIPVDETIELFNTFEIFWTLLWTYVHLVVYVSIAAFAWVNAMEEVATVAKIMSYMLGAQLYVTGQAFANRLRLEYPLSSRTAISTG